MRSLKLVHEKEIDILDQLRVEEALLRTCDQNWCIINESSPSKAIVMGLSGRPEELINHDLQQRDGIPIIKRFSGGGTVVVDEKTLFITLIFQKDVHEFEPYPKNIMEFSAKLYNIDLRENDYVIGDKKFGGNAQYIQKTRWLHHTSFLWDFDPKSMEYLMHPKKTPDYRKERSHLDFLCKMRDHFPSKSTWIRDLKTRLSQDYNLIETPFQKAQEAINRDHRKSTIIL